TWMGLGSEGRREHTFRTDQDNALVFELVQDQKQRARVQEYFLSLATMAVSDLERTGHPRCRNNFMASNPKWCKDLGSWKRQFEEWIATPMTPEIFLSTIFFDFRAVAGDSSIAEDLRTRVASRAQRFPQFLKFFVKYFLSMNRLCRSLPIL
ncbi:MAG: hypothetical protein FJY85_07100, partial [Deltaproteobacteria bacterium]|nr:hypothetical protein [Deltaproteobacteria bacterium]